MSSSYFTLYEGPNSDILVSQIVHPLRLMIGFCIFVKFLHILYVLNCEELGSDYEQLMTVTTQLRNYLPS